MRRLALAIAVLLLFGVRANAALALLSQFDSNLGTPVSLGFDSGTNLLWVYGSSDATISSFTRGGVAMGTIARPGEAANDADITFASANFTLGSTSISAGTLLFINGESGTADIYAVDQSKGTVLASLTTEFGNSHVVGGAYHAGRNSFFLVQDRVPSGTINDNLIAEISPTTGKVLNTFYTTTAIPGFTVNFGDLEVAANGNLVVVSEDESSIAEFTPTGGLVSLRALPGGVGSLSGLGFDQDTLWVVSTGGNVSQLAVVPEPSSFLLVGCGAMGAFAAIRRRAGERPFLGNL